MFLARITRLDVQTIFFFPHTLITLDLTTVLIQKVVTSIPSLHDTLSDFPTLYFRLYFSTIFFNRLNQTV